jgi:hypothetical protein
MKVLLLVLSILAFLVLAIFAIAGGTLANAQHLFATLGIGLALFAASFLPIPNG